MATKLPSPDVLGKQPDAAELQRLVKNYPSYEWEHRNALLYGYFQGHTLDQLLEDKFHALEIDAATLSPPSLGGHARWVHEKIKKAFVRILYLRYRLDLGMSQREANKRLLEHEQFSLDELDSVQSKIRKQTHSPVLDKNPSSPTSEP